MKQTKMKREMKTETNLGFESRYSKKVRAGNQMYGPGCCANGIGPLKMRNLQTFDVDNIKETRRR